MIPIAIQTLDRPDYFTKTLLSLERSGAFGQCSDIHVFDCGSSKDSLARVENLCLTYNLELHKSPTGILRLNEGVAKMDAVLGEDFIRLEDDILVCKNWYPYVVEVMNSLERWEVINFYCLDSNNLVRPTNINNVYRKGYTTFYGICLTAFKHGVTEKINRCKRETGHSFDIAIGLECGWYEENHLEISGIPKICTGSNTLCVHSPSLAQHIGKESIIGAPYNEVKDFVGEDFNALELLN